PRPGTSARRSHPARRVKRARRPSRPLLTQRQAREVAGILVLLFAALGLVALLSGAGGALEGLRSFWTRGFGLAWPIPLGLVLAVGLYLLWPERPAARALEVGATVLAAAALIGLLDLFWGAAGRAGHSLDVFLVGLAGPVGAGTLLVAGLLLGLIVVFHFSVGSVLLTAANVLRAGYAERQRLDALVHP